MNIGFVLNGEMCLSAAWIQLKGEKLLRKNPINKRRLIICLIIILSAFLAGCKTQPPSWLEPLPSTTPSGYSSANQLFSVYFTDVNSSDYRGGPDRFLADDLDNARFQIDAALYDLNLWTIRNALVRAHDRGVNVRLVVEADSLDRSEIQDLINAGIPVVGDQAESLMHNKFLVIDGTDVWTGSMNMTVNGAYRHLNNMVRVRSSLVAQNYTSEFEEMFLDGFFGENVKLNTPHPILSIDGIRVETYFSPDNSTGDRILELLLAANSSIDFLFYSFTSDPIGDALLKKSDQGITIRGVVDYYQEGTGIGGEYQRLKDHNINIYLDGHPEKMHHKVIIIDQQIVVTGSYNPTHSAETKNDENTLIIHDQEIARVFLREFDWIFEDGSAR